MIVRNIRNNLACAVLALAAVVMVASTPQASAAISFDQNVTPDIIFGTGNTNGLFTVDRSNGVELGLRAKIPFVGTTNSNGDGTYSYSIVEQESAPDSGSCPAVGGCWNFDWTVNTDELGTSAVKIDGLTYLMEIDFDPSAGTNFLPFDPITPNVAPLNAPFFDHSIGDNLTANGGGTGATDGPTYAALIAANNVAQNSWRNAFFASPPAFSYDPTIDGTYDVRLSAFDGTGAMVARTSIQVIIGAGGAAICGDGLVGIGEACDDGNLTGGDGCSPTCVVEPNFECTGEPSFCVSLIPASSEWGLGILLLIGMTAGSMLFRRTGTV